ncbi:MAG: AMP-binding protein [Deltaproteobacteria bacterium]|nr:AMP-binding protein [Deltaproteobacteria bacterium]
MSKPFRVPRNPDEIMEWINSIPMYKEDQPYDPSFKSMQEIEDIQNSKLPKQMERLEKFSPFYREKFKEWGLDPKSIKTTDDLEKIPLTTKADFMADRGESFKLEQDFNNIMEYILYDITYTTGTTTGMPSRFYNTTYDMFLLTWGFRIGCKIGYLEPDDIVMNLFPFHFVPHIGFYRTWHFAASAGMSMAFGLTGAPLPGFPHNIHRSMQQAIEDIEKKKVTALSGIGSYIRRLIMSAEEQGRDFSRISKVQALGEAVPKGMRDDMRRRLQNMGAGEIFISNAFGFTECQAAFQECTELGGCHTGLPEMFLEAVDEKTGKRKPDGEPGLLAITHLDRRGTCLLRYLVGDIVAIIHETCPYCGRNDARLITTAGSTYGTRTKELLNVKGTLINPITMCDAVVNTEGVLEYQFIVTKERKDDPYSMDLLKLKVGVEKDMDRKKLEATLTDKVQRAVELRPKIEFVEDLSEIYDPANLKATRIIDERPTE